MLFRSTGLNPMPDGVPGAGGMEVGWRLARGAWHQGYATEAAVAAVGVAFGGAGLAELWSMTAVGNQPSRAVMRRLGMSLHAHFDHPGVAAGHPLRPHVAYRLRHPGAAAVPSRPHVAYRLPGPGPARPVRPRPGLRVGARTPGETDAATGRATDRG